MGHDRLTAKSSHQDHFGAPDLDGGAQRGGASSSDEPKPDLEMEELAVEINLIEKCTGQGP